MRRSYSKFNELLIITLFKFRMYILVGLWPQNYRKIESKNYKNKADEYYMEAKRHADFL